MERTITAAVNQFLVTPEVLAGTDLILTAFETLVTRNPAFAGLFVTPCPFPVPETPIVLVWHPVLSNRPAHSWLRTQIEYLSPGAQKASDSNRMAWTALPSRSLTRRRHTS